MKASGQCPKCGCTRLYVVHPVSQPAHDSINIVVPMAVTCADVPSPAVGGTDDNMHRAEIGRFETWICSACGLTEWYARNVKTAFEALARMSPHVRVVERGAKEPYR